jgi:hypothetical protein
MKVLLIEKVIVSKPEPALQVPLAVFESVLLRASRRVQAIIGRSEASSTTILAAKAETAVVKKNCY